MGSPLAVLGSNEMEMRGVIRSISYQPPSPLSTPLHQTSRPLVGPELINDSSQHSAVPSPSQISRLAHSISPSWLVDLTIFSGLEAPQNVSKFKVIIVQCLTVKFSPQIFVFCQIFHLLFAQIHIWSFLNCTTLSVKFINKIIFIPNIH